MRVMPRRTGGELATTDLVFVVLIVMARGERAGRDVSEVLAARVDGEGRITDVPRRVGGRKDGPH